MNECEDQNGFCGQICTNTPGSFSCNCAPDHYLAVDGQTCVLLNPHSPPTPPTTVPPQSLTTPTTLPPTTTLPPPPTTLALPQNPSGESIFNFYFSHKSFLTQWQVSSCVVVCLWFTITLDHQNFPTRLQETRVIHVHGHYLAQVVGDMCSN